MPGLVDATASVVDICGNSADSCSQLFLLSVIHLNDIAVDQHLPCVCPEVPGSEQLHLLQNDVPFRLIQTDFLADGASTFRHCILLTAASGQTRRPQSECRDIPTHSEPSKSRRAFLLSCAVSRPL